MSSIAIPSAMIACAIVAGCAADPARTTLYGEPAVAAAADRTIVITPATRQVNVDGGETVAFTVGDRQFAWNFTTARTIDGFRLNDVAPAGMISHPVYAYIAPDPRQVRGGGMP